LSPRLVTPARLIFEAANGANVTAILFGGAAAKLHGAKRGTKDLDINVSSLGFATFLPNEFVCHPRTVDTRQHITWANTVKCDVATERTELVNDAFETYSCVTEDGIRYASANILLADKIRTYGRRPFQAVQKQENDLYDVLQLIDVMRQKGDKMPDELKESILSENILRAFLERVPIE
ncbi:hypothetical protein HETIRDRAFT_247078, partial [Heterobasidion irregulare TC 32-1]